MSHVLPQIRRHHRIAGNFLKPDGTSSQAKPCVVVPGGRSFREIVRQQWNFSSPSTIREHEEYHVELSDVAVLELVIVPDVSRGAACASLKSLRVS
jgi:hypothetical protein